MNGRDSIQSLLVLRKLTRAIADVVRTQMTEYLATLTPLIKPAAALGDYIQGGAKETTRRVEKVFKEVQALYESIAPAKPFTLPKELTTPLNFPSATLEITPVEYAHAAETGGAPRTIMVRRPLSWYLTYTGYAPARAQELMGSNTQLRATAELQKFVLSQVMLHVILNNQPGFLHILEGLHFPVTTTKLPELGELPITRIGAAISTSRPSDAVVLESAELTGMDAFEEVISVEEIAQLADPLKERLLEIARKQAPELVSR
jgi:hypothetical protein